MNYYKKRVLVLGLARSGMAAVRLLLRLGAEVTLSEQKPKEKLDELPWLTQDGVEVIGQGDEIFEREYDVAVKNPGIPYKLWFISRLEEAGVPVITEIELAYQAAMPQHYIAITGTNGKTTTTMITYEIIRSVYPDITHYAGNIGLPLCDVVLRENLLENKNNYIILEISNFQLLHISSFRPEIATIINMTPDHLDYMGSVEAYYESKTNIYKNMDSKCLFIKNIDDVNILKYTKRFPVRSAVKTVSLTSEKADCTVDDESIYVDGIPYVSLKDIKIVGAHNIQNIMISAAIANAVGIGADTVNNIVSSFNGVEHRIEFVREHNGVKYYNDSKATNPDAAATAVKAFSEPLILLVGGFEKGLPMDNLRDRLGSNVKKVIGFGQCGNRLVRELVGDRGTVVYTMEEAVAAAAKLAEAGDVVLLSPATSSFDRFESFEERGRFFKELVFRL